MLDLLLSILIWGCIAGNIFLGLVVYAKNSRSFVNNVFAVIAFIAAFWAVGLFFYQHPVFFPSEIWLRVVYITVLFLVSSIFIFSYTFPLQTLDKNYKLVSLCFISAFPFIYLITSTQSFLVTVVDKPWGPDQVLGPTYIFFGLWSGLFSLWGVLNFWKSYKKVSGVSKLQLKYLFLGMFVFCLVPVVIDIILPLVFHNSRFIWLSPISGVFLIGFTAYAIVVHRLMDIRLIVARSLAYTILLLILGTFYTTGMFLASTYFIKQATSIASLAVSTILALFVAFTFQPLKTELEKLTDKIFFKGHYDMQDLLSSLGTIMNSYIDLELLNKRILETITEEVRITRGAFIVFGEDTSSIYNIIEIGFNNRFVMSYPEASSFFPLLETTVFDDLEEGQVKNLMRERNISLVRILKVKDKIIGLLVLGGKASGEIYSSQDLKFLDIISPEVAVAIQNSLSYDKIKKFNYILSQEIQKATADLKQANTRLKELDSLKNDFVSIASHELRTPMTAIRSYAWMALHRSDVKLSEKMEKYLIRVLLSTERLINLVNDMLNISRIEAGKIEIIPEPIDPVSLCKDIIDEVYYSKSLSKKVNFHLLENKVPKVFADPDKLRQVLLNLVGNSLKFTQDGGSITLSCFSDGKVVEIAVKDTGTGISKDDLGRLFQKFSRLDNSYVAAATSGGTGLGLYISKRIIELMHGRIWASSEGVGKGATFTFSLPVASKEVLEHADLYTIKPIDEVKPLEPAAI